MFGCAAWQVVDLQWNRLKQVPAELTSMPKLAVLNLAYNELAALPSGVQLVCWTVVCRLKRFVA